MPEPTPSAPRRAAPTARRSVPAVTRRRALLLLASPLALPAVARAQSGGQSGGAWPNRPVRIINPYGPGGTADIMIRPLAERLERVFGRPFVIENRPGAGGSLGTGAAAAERADGHVLLCSNLGPLAVAPAAFRSLGYDPARSFRWIAMLGGAPLLCAVRAEHPARTLPDYVAAARAAPEAISFGSSGIASAGHLVGALFAREVGASLLHVPYRSAAEVQQSVLGGNADSLWDTLAPQAEAIRAGLLRGLAVSSAERVEATPEVPTLAELGLPACTANNWFLLAAPAGLDPAVAARLRAATVELMAEPATRRRLDAAGIVPLGNPEPEEIGRFVAAEGERWQAVARDAGVRPG